MTRIIGCTLWSTLLITIMMMTVKIELKIFWDECIQYVHNGGGIAVKKMQVIMVRIFVTHAHYV